MNWLEGPLSIKDVKIISIHPQTGKVIEDSEDEDDYFKKLLDKVLDDDPPEVASENSTEQALKNVYQNGAREDIENIKENREYQFISISKLEKFKALFSSTKSSQLNERMEALCFPKDKSYFSYSEIRDEVCAINLELNQRQEIAPQFRSMCKPPRVSMTKYNELDSMMSNDRQLIDIHWLWLSYDKNSHIEPPEYKGLLSGKDFDWELAERFVKRVGKTQLKSSLLGLTEFEELMLLSLQRKSTKDRLSTIGNAYSDAVGKIRTAALSPKSKFPIDTLENTYQIFRALKIARGSPIQAARIYTLITTEDIDQKKVSKIKKWLLKNKINLE